MECIMLGLGTECGFLDYCFRVTHKLLKLSNRGRKHEEVLLRRDRHIRRRLLKIEPLECRAMMSANGLSSLISPIWFQDCSTANQPGHAGVATWTAESIAPAANTNSGSVNSQANVYDWIVQFNTNDLGGITNLPKPRAFWPAGALISKSFVGWDWKARNWSAAWEARSMPSNSGSRTTPMYRASSKTPYARMTRYPTILRCRNFGA